MDTNKTVKSIKGKYAGECPICKLDRGDWEVQGSNCKRCGHEFTTVANPLTLDGEIKEPDCVVK